MCLRFLIALVPFGIVSAVSAQEADRQYLGGQTLRGFSAVPSHTTLMTGLAPTEMPSAEGIGVMQWEFDGFVVDMFVPENYGSQGALPGVMLYEGPDRKARSIVANGTSPWGELAASMGMIAAHVGGRPGQESPDLPQIMQALMIRAEQEAFEGNVERAAILAPRLETELWTTLQEQGFAMDFQCLISKSNAASFATMQDTKDAKRTLMFLRDYLSGSASYTEATQDFGGPGDQFFQQGEWQRAVQAYEQHLQLNPKDGARMFRLGYAQIQIGQYAESVMTYSRCAELGFQPETCMYNIACGYSLMGQTEKGLKYLAKSLQMGFNQMDLVATDPDLNSLRQHPSFSAIVESRGKVSASEGGNPQKPSEAMVRDLAEKARNSFQAGSWEQAFVQYGHLTEMTPENGLVWFQRGFAGIKIGELKIGVQSFKKSAELGFELDASQYNIACCYSLMGDVEAGLKWLAVAVDSGFDNMELANSDPDVANLRKDARFEAILKGAPYSKDGVSEKQKADLGPMLSQANQYFQQGEFVQALEAYLAYLEFAPEDGAANFNAGYCAIVVGKLELGMKQFQRCLELGVFVAPSSYNMACCYSLSGNVEKGVEWFGKALDAGFSDAQLATTDKDLDNLRGDKKFQELLARLTGDKDSR